MKYKKALLALLLTAVAFVMMAVVVGAEENSINIMIEPAGSGTISNMEVNHNILSFDILPSTGWIFDYIQDNTQSYAIEYQNGHCVCSSEGFPIVSITLTVFLTTDPNAGSDPSGSGTIVDPSIGPGTNPGTDPGLGPVPGGDDDVCPIRTEVSPTGGGTITVDKDTAKAGETVIFTVIAAEGYELHTDSVGVYKSIALSEATTIEEEVDLDIVFFDDNCWCDCSFTMPDGPGYVTIRAEFVLKDGIGARLVGHTISLDGDIGVNFYMELDPGIEDSPSAYMQFTVPTSGKTETQIVYINPQEPEEGQEEPPHSTLVELEEKTYYVFKCRVAAKEMTSEIKAQIVDGENRGTEYSYSVKEYADYLLAHTGDNTKYAKAAPLVRAMLNYGAYSQVYFKHNTDNLANSSLKDQEKELGDVEDDVSGTYATPNLPDDVTFDGATLTLRSETSLSLYFKVDGTETLEFSLPEGVPVGIYLEPEKDLIDGCQVVRIRGIAAKYLGDTFTVTVKKGNDTGTISYSPMTYCKKAEASSIANLANVAKALYAYWKQAKTYFDYTTTTWQ